MIKLRSHHLLCFLGFRGLGYSSTFTQNLATIRKLILKDSYLVLTLEASPDEICKNCPELISGLCSSDDKVKVKDYFLLNFLKEKNLTVKSAYEKIKVLTEEDFISLCQDCSWYPLGYCLEGFLKLKST